MLPSSAIGFGISLRGKNSRQPIALTCTDSSDATVGASPGAVAGTEEAEPPSQNASGFASPQATLSGYWLTGGVFELQYSCSGAGGYLLHTWFRDASGQVCTSPSARPDPPLVCKRSPPRQSAPRMQALTTAPGPAPRMQALTTARRLGPPTGARAARLASRAHGELDRGRCAWLHALRRGRAHAQDDAGRGHEVARLHSGRRPFR